MSPLRTYHPHPFSLAGALTFPPSPSPSPQRTSGRECAHTHARLSFKFSISISLTRKSQDPESKPAKLSKGRVDVRIRLVSFFFFEKEGNTFSFLSPFISYVRCPPSRRDRERGQIRKIRVLERGGLLFGRGVV